MVVLPPISKKLIANQFLDHLPPKFREKHSTLKRNNKKVEGTMASTRHRNLFQMSGRGHEICMEIPFEKNCF